MTVSPGRLRQIDIRQPLSRSIPNRAIGPLPIKGSRSFREDLRSTTREITAFRMD